jgi:O-antigen/teichoic acid export membrane protein
MPDEESYLNESLRKIAKGAGIGFTGAFIGMAFGYFSRIVIARFFVLAQNLVSSTIGFQDLRYKVYVKDLFQNTFKLAAIVALLLLGFGVLGAAWSWVLAIMLTPFLALYFLDKKLFPVFHSKIKSILVEKELFSFSFLCYLLVLQVY